MSGAVWRNPRILYTFLCVFLSGAVAGAITMRFGYSPERYGGPYWKDGAREISLHRFKKELDLSPEQAKDMEAVLDDFMTYYQTLQVQMDDMRATGKQRILRILKNDQKARFEKMIDGLQSKQLH